MTTTQSPSFISALVSPGPGSNSGKKSWSIDVESIWVPFFTATNAMGDTNISHETLGAPIRLGLQKDGSVRFTQTGRPSMRVAPELSTQIRVVRENFVASLQSYTGTVIEEHTDAYRAQVERNQHSGTPLLAQDAKLLQEELDRLERVTEEAVAEAATADPTDATETSEAPAPTGRGRGKAAAQPQGEVDPALAVTATS